MVLFQPTRLIGATRYKVTQRRNYLGQDYIITANVPSADMPTLGAPEDDDTYAYSNGRLYRWINGAWADFYPSGTGAPGVDGRSAYQIDVDNGYQGTVTQWLASLHGAAGKDGLPGKDGAKGADGATGATGPAGPPNTLAIGTVSTLATGSAATATITGTSPNQVLTLGIPRGATGDSSAPVASAYSNPTPALNTAAQLSITRDADVSYNVDVAITSLLIATTGAVFLEYADNAAMTTNVVIVASGVNSVGGVLNITNTATVALVGRIPAGKYRRIRTQNVSGIPTFTSRQGQEVLL